MTLIDGDTILFTLTAGILAAPGRRRGDFMATVKVDAQKQLSGEYRFRWWNTPSKLDMNGGADDDDKSFFGINAGPDSPESREKLIGALRKLASCSPGFVNVYEERGEWTPEVFIYEVMMRGPMRAQLTIEEKP